MTLLVATTSTPPEAASIVPASQVRAVARRLRSPFADRALAVTEPLITTNQTGLEYEQRVTRGTREIRFRRGTLRLALTQRVYIADDVAECPRGIWQEHENGHVADNTGVMGGIERELRADTAFMAILDGSRWYPRDDFARLQTEIQARVAAVFGAMTGTAVAARDTETEYARVEERIRTECGEVPV